MTVLQLFIFIVGVLVAIGGLVYLIPKALNINVPDYKSSLWLFAAFAHAIITISVTIFILVDLGS